ncbi:MAG TPA: DinB family protein [Blastocatellia bacterium]|nr:DinB family protein [Blastocatellia bacterium]
MKPRSLLLVYFILFPAVSLFAQSSGASADPITGTWTGHMGPGATPQYAITLALTFDGKGGVSGTLVGLQTPGEIKSGTFDPQTGALKLQAAPKGDSAVRLTFEGTVVLGAATGRVSGDNQTGVFKITKKVAEESAPAQQPGANDTAAALRYGFGEVSGWVTKAADLVPADKYDYRPTPSVRTFGQLIAHIADSQNYYCARAVKGRTVQWSDAVEKGSVDKATLAQKLKQSIDACNAAYGGAGEVGSLSANVGHTSLHYGNIITYMRMLGLTPPSN